MKRTVVHLVYSLGFGGLEQVIVNLINNSSEYNVQHVIITLVDIQDLYESINPVVPIYSLNKKPKSDFMSHYSLYKLLKTIKPDVINTYNFGTIEYQFTAFLSGIKTQIHSDHGRGGDDSSGQSIKRNLIRKFISYFLKAYIVVSPDLYKWGENTLGLKSDKLKLLYNGVDIEEYEPGNDKFKKFTLCTVGRADPIKNQSLLINAYKTIYDRNHNFKNTQLLIAGDGPIYKDLQKQVALLGMESNIQLLGYRKDVVNIMKQSHLFILSSNYEAMPMTVLEAMACQLPVICTDVGGAKYLISDKEGWLVEKNNINKMADCIEMVFENEELSSTKSEAGRKLVVNNFSIKNMVSEYMKIYSVDTLK